MSTKSRREKQIRRYFRRMIRLFLPILMANTRVEYASFPQFRAIKRERDIDEKVRG